VLSVREPWRALAWHSCLTTLGMWLKPHDDETAICCCPNIQFGYLLHGECRGRQWHTLQVPAGTLSGIPHKHMLSPAAILAQMGSPAAWRQLAPHAELPTLISSLWECDPRIVDSALAHHARCVNRSQREAMELPKIKSSFEDSHMINTAVLPPRTQHSFAYGKPASCPPPLSAHLSRMAAPPGPSFPSLHMHPTRSTGGIRA
jgi:hypothetical protein